MSEEPRVPGPHGSPGEPPLANPFRAPSWSSGDLKEKGWIPPRWFVLWWFLLLFSVVLFYVLLTPVWLGLRAAAWAAELRSRARCS